MLTDRMCLSHPTLCSCWWITTLTHSSEQYTACIVLINYVSNCVDYYHNNANCVLGTHTYLIRLFKHCNTFDIVSLILSLSFWHSPDIVSLAKRTYDSVCEPSQSLDRLLRHWHNTPNHTHMTAGLRFSETLLRVKGDHAGRLVRIERVVPAQLNSNWIMS